MSATTSNDCALGALPQHVHNHNHQHRQAHRASVAASSSNATSSSDDTAFSEPTTIATASTGASPVFSPSFPSFSAISVKPAPGARQRSASHSGSARRLSRARSSSSLLDEFFRHPERRAVWQRTEERANHEQATKMENRQVMGDLVDFLRNHEPPPDNFMSIPEEGDGHERGRWLRLNPLVSRRSKSAPRKPVPIRLPDTAVAGTTIGGHRHIAISIPVEYSPFGPLDRTQYPVYSKDSSSHFQSETDSVMRFTDSRGVVTVLRTVSENRESVVANDAIASPRRFYSPVSVTPDPTPAPSHLARSKSLSESGDNAHRDYHTASLPPAPLPQSSPARRPSTARLARQNSSAGAPPSSSGTVRSLGPPAVPVSASAPSSPHTRHPVRRWSTLPAPRGGPPESIEGVLYGQRGQKMPASTTQALARAATFSGRTRSNTSNTVGSSTSASTAPKVNIAKAIPMIRVPGSASTRNSASDLRSLARGGASPREVNVITSNPLESPLETPPLSAKFLRESRRSRRDKVSAKKRKDIEASRASRERRRKESEEGSLYRSSSLAPSDTTSRSPADESDSDPPMAARRLPSRQPSMSPVVVVANVEPSTPPKKPSITVSHHSSPASTPPRTPLTADSLSTHYTPNPRGRSPGCREPADDVPLDRVSLSRRREWRQARDTQPCRSLNGRIPISPSRLPTSSRSLPSFAEERMREMERRMQRLERSGDMWLHAIVPVLDSLNRTLTMIQDERRLLGANGSAATGVDDDGGNDGDIDNEDPARNGDGVARGGDKGAKGVIGVGGFPRLTRRSTLNEKALLDLKRIERGELRPDELRGSSGLDALEPLMRELQQAATRGQAPKPIEPAMNLIEAEPAR